jgi:hypothetical protein
MLPIIFAVFLPAVFILERLSSGLETARHCPPGPISDFGETSISFTALAVVLLAGV